MRLFDMFKSKHKDFILDAFCDPAWTVKEVITPVPGGCADCELTYSDDSARVRRIEKWRCYMYAETQVGAFPLYMEVRDYSAGNEAPVILCKTFGKENDKHTYSQVPVDAIDPSWTLSVRNDGTYFSKTYSDAQGRERRFEAWAIGRIDEEGIYALDLIYVRSKTYDGREHTKEEYFVGDYEVNEYDEPSLKN